MLILLLAYTLCVSPYAAQRHDAVIASGKLAHHGYSNELFQINQLWIRVAEDTEFHRWLSQGINRGITVNLLTSSAKLGDERGTRILTGKLVHVTAPSPTPNTVDAVGEIPPGDLPMVHILFLKDELTGTFGAVTLQTTDRATASKFEGLDDAIVSIVLRINARAE